MLWVGSLARPVKLVSVPGKQAYLYLVEVAVGWCHNCYVGVVLLCIGVPVPGHTLLLVDPSGGASVAAPRWSNLSTSYGLCVYRCWTAGSYLCHSFYWILQYIQLHRLYCFKACYIAILSWGVERGPTLHLFIQVWITYGYPFLSHLFLISAGASFCQVIMLDGSYLLMGQLLAVNSCVPPLSHVPLALPQDALTPLKADQWSKDLLQYLILTNSFVHT